MCHFNEEQKMIQGMVRIITTLVEFFQPVRL